jgi:hypothetical protein
MELVDDNNKKMCMGNMYTLVIGGKTEYIDMTLLGKFGGYFMRLHFNLEKSIAYVSEDYDLFIIFLNYIRYAAILSSDKEKIFYSKEAFKSYGVEGFENACNDKIKKLIRYVKTNYVGKNEDGTLLCTGTIITDKETGVVNPNGVWTFYQDNKPAIIGSISNGNMIGVWKVWVEDRYEFVNVLNNQIINFP